MTGTGGNSTIRLLDRYPLLLLSLLFVGSFATSSVVPLTGLFIVEGLGEVPWKMGIYACIHATITLLVNRFYGRWIDRGRRLKILPIVSSLALISAMILVSQIQNYLVFASLGAVLLGISSAALSSMYSFGRLFAEQTGREPARFNSLLRMQTSLAWMIGPALSLIVYGRVDFTLTFLGIAVLGVVWLVACLAVIPSGFASHHPVNMGGKTAVSYNKQLLVACLPVLLIGIGNAMFLSTAPLFFTRELSLPAETAGLALTVKCFIEVPAIYFCVNLARRMGERPALMLAAVCAVLFYALIHGATSMPEILTLAVLDGIYYGIFAGVSMTFVQNAAPRQPGMATAYYVSTMFTGGLIGHLLTGMIASWYSFQTTTLVSCSAAGLALGALLLTHRRPRTVTEEAA